MITADGSGLTTTDNPQTVPEVQDTGNDAAQFQQSAGSDVLTQSQPLTVQKTGEPINSGAVADGMSAAVLMFVVVSSVVLVAVAAYAFRAVLKRPDKPNEPAEALAPVLEAARQEAASKPAKTAGKKKQSRSKRAKNNTKRS